MRAGMPALPPRSDSTPIKQKRPSGFPKGRDYRTPILHDEALFLFMNQQSALVQILTAQAVTRPGHRFEPLFLNRLAAIVAVTVLASLDSIKRRVNRFQKLPVVG